MPEAYVTEDRLVIIGGTVYDPYRAITYPAKGYYLRGLKRTIASARKVIVRRLGMAGAREAIEVCYPV